HQDAFVSALVAAPRYKLLTSRMRSEKITPREHKELIELIDRVEIENSRRIQLLIEVAKRQGTTVEALLKTTRTASAL
ncbi:MAG TPA: hypothetical protein VFE47_07785, partial [Tepidisphaeraceae bacterium]|nr:hypothetical protein [Tepidisphaeraceae bacterium]